MKYDVYDWKNAKMFLCEGESLEGIFKHLAANMVDGKRRVIVRKEMEEMGDEYVLVIKDFRLVSFNYEGGWIKPPMPTHFTKRERQ